MAEEHSPEQDVAELAERNERLEHRSDWERKRRDGGVPGAPPPPEDAGDD